MRQEALLQADQKNVGEFQPFGSMKRNQGYSIRARIGLFCTILIESHFS